MVSILIGIQCFVFWFIFVLREVCSQEPSVVLPQGKVVGVKVYPESSPYPVNMFLGIPYAQPPIGRLRFSPPVPHKGWNRTLNAHRYGPRCPQASSSPGPCSHDISEDCLYLNIWTPQGAGETDSERLPVILFLHGETWSSDSPCELPGQDMAAEGIIFVSASYRLNIFGFFTLASMESRGNMGLSDQYLVLVWLRENVERFGGDPGSITLAGHSAGATSVLFHLSSPRTAGLFHRAIIISPIEIWRTIEDLEYPDWLPPSTFTRSLLVFLGCSGGDAELLRCAQQLKMDDILRTYQIVTASGNTTGALRPSSDSFLPDDARTIPESLAHSFARSSPVRNVPTLFGYVNRDSVNHNEEFWWELASEGVRGIEQHLNSKTIPSLLRLHGLFSSKNRIELQEAVRWEFLGDMATTDPWLWAEAVARMESSGRNDAAVAILATRLSRYVSPLYVYRYTEPGGVDLHGVQLNHTGAGRGTELPLMLGPTLLQQLVRRRLLPGEETLSRILRILQAEFVKTGGPPRNRVGAGWVPYDEKIPYIQGISVNRQSMESRRDAEFWLKYLPRLANASSYLDSREYLMQLKNTQIGGSSAVWALGALSATLAALLGIAGILLRRSSLQQIS